MMFFIEQAAFPHKTYNLVHHITCAIYRKQSAGNVSIAKAREETSQGFL
jgi:hypothetical protein